MQKTTATATQDGGGVFSRKGSIFGGGSGNLGTRPSTRNGSTTTTIDPYDDAVSPGDSTLSSQPSIPPRKASFSFASKTHQSPYTSRKSSTATASLAYSPERRPSVARSKSVKQTLSSKSSEPRQSLSNSQGDRPTRVPSGPSHTANRASISSIAPYSSMLATSLGREMRPSTAHYGPSFNGAIPIMNANQPQSPSMETITYQHIQDMAAKRISTLDYLRKAHEGRVYWFNTLLFKKPDLARMPYFETRKLARRATNYLLLGLSLPTILDLNSSTPADFLRTLNALLGEFDAFQQIHPPDGTSASSLSRARLPQMFKRATNTGGKSRRTSSAAEIGLPMSAESYDAKSINGSISSVSTTSTSFPSGDSDLLPGEEYSYLLTPSLPFDPDFYETFATLCDVLIDCYTRLMTLVASPKDCGPQIAEMFTKADARIRKLIVQGVVKEFEESSRSGVKSEVASVGKVVLGGMM